MTSLNEIRENWEGFAQCRTLFMGYLCGLSKKRGGRWTQEEFFATGEREVNKVMDYLGSLDLSPLKTATALDFGCGVGRLTRAISQHFEMCWGVDISPTMIRLAREYHGNNSRCSFWLNEADNLRKFPDGYFGFIYTSITLQHIPMRYVRNYLLELVRVLRPGGVFVFQIPDRVKSGVSQRVESYLGLRRRLKRMMRLLMGKNLMTLRMDMHCFPEKEIREILSDQDIRIVDVRLTNSAQGSFNGDLQFLDRPEPGRTAGSASNIVS